MSVVVPSILEGSRRRIEEKLRRVAGLVDAVQVDIVDGVFAGPPTWPYTEGGFSALPAGFDIHEMGDMRYEVDLMVKGSEGAMRAFLGAGAARFVVHIEEARNLPQMLDELENKYGRDKEFAPELLSVGLSIRIDTDLSALEPYLPRIDYVQFMGIAHIGRQGQSFDPRVIAKIQTFKRAHPEILAQVDGGVSLLNAPDLFRAGATRLVVGSALWESLDPAATIRELNALAEEHVRYH
jgi:ribulose-phosphate 3-epimerase